MVKVFVQTYGCSLNHSDSEVMKGVLVHEGHSLVQSADEADVLVVNSCTVKSNPEQKLFYQLRNRSTPIVVAGCVPAADPSNEHFVGVSVIGPKALSQVAFAVEETYAGRVVRILEDVDGERLSLPTIVDSSTRAIIPINAGCLSHCTYCKTKHARGHLQSYSLESIEKQFRQVVNGGAREVWLTSQDTSAYGLDIGTDIVELLTRLLHKEGDYRIRLGMANPQHIIPRLERFVAVMSHPRMFRFVHIPVQSASDAVLRGMKRGYTVEMFRKVVDALRQSISDITIATDLIVGFPSENEEDALMTEKLVKDLELAVVNQSKFYSRPGTEAANMKLLPTDVVKARSVRLREVCKRVASHVNSGFVGKEYSVLVCEQGKNGTMVGRTDSYVPVILREGVLGERRVVRVSSSGVFDIRERTTNRNVYKKREL